MNIQLAGMIRSENDELLMTPNLSLKPGATMANRTGSKSGLTLQTPTNPMRRKLGNLSNTPRVLGSLQKNTGSKNGAMKRSEVFKKPSTPTIVVPAKRATAPSLPVLYEEIENGHVTSKEQLYEDIYGPERDALLYHLDYHANQVRNMPVDYENDVYHAPNLDHLTPEELFSDIL